MIITFTSNISGEAGENKIEFKAPVAISQYEEFKVFEFEEPSRKEMNRIEVAEDKINIMSGPSTIELIHGEKVDIAYAVGQGNYISLQTHLKRINNEENKKIEFEYTLSNNGKEIGNYIIQLKITE